jgi:2-keto-4-pentenoate hydratase/2-oxohepta-3-ene-1,7-dioic acid hydratase in catechol pathway
MRLLTFEVADRVSYGVLTGDGIVDIGAVLGPRYPDIRSVLTAGALEVVAQAALKAKPGINSDDVTFLPVIAEPRKIFCVGVNYDEHRRETGRDKSVNPTVFTRFADTLVGHLQPIVKPRLSDELDFEGELAVVIGKPGRHIRQESALSHVAGYSCFNDASVRDFQRHSSQFTPGKNFPLTGGFGPTLVTPDEIDDAHGLGIQTRLNGSVMQDANTSSLIFNIPALIAYLSSFTPLLPGDVIATGTPGGVGSKRNPPVFMKAGDEVIVEIESVGCLVNSIANEG